MANDGLTDTECEWNHVPQLAPHQMPLPLHRVGKLRLVVVHEGRVGDGDQPCVDAQCI